MSLLAKELLAVVLGQLIVSGLVIADGVYGKTEQSINTDPGHKEQLSIDGVTFSCPNRFTPQHTQSDSEVAYLQHERYDLALFVAVPRSEPGPDYVKHLGTLLASYLFPKERATFVWKRLDCCSKISKFETRGGEIQGFNRSQRLIFEFRTLRVLGKQIIVGHLFGMDRDSEAAWAFEQNLGGLSLPGLEAQAHVIASITGEKYSEVNPGGGIRFQPEKKK